MKLTQNLSGKQFDFQACITSGSVIEWINAASSKMSNTHFTAAVIQIKKNLLRKKSKFFTLSIISWEFE